MVPVTTNPVYSYTVFFFEGIFSFQLLPRSGIEWTEGLRMLLWHENLSMLLVLATSTSWWMLLKCWQTMKCSQNCVFFSVSSWYLHLSSPAILVNWFQSFWRVLEVLDVLLFFLCFCVMVFIWSLQTGGQITIQKIQGHWKDLGSGSLCQVAGRGKECQSQILDDEIPRRCVFPCWVNCISTVWLDLRKTSV